MLLSIAEKELINRILLTADYFLRLNAFIDKYLHPTIVQESNSDYSAGKLSTDDFEEADDKKGKELI